MAELIQQPSIMSEEEWTQLRFTKLSVNVYERTDRYAIVHQQRGHTQERKIRMELFDTTPPTESDVIVPPGFNVWFYIDNVLQFNGYFTDKQDLLDVTKIPSR